MNFTEKKGLDLLKQGKKEIILDLYGKYRTSEINNKENNMYIDKINEILIKEYEA